MMFARRRWLQRIAVTSQCALIALGVAWAVSERPAPLVNVRWRDGLSDEARRQRETDLYLENGKPADEAWLYELGSPRTGDIRRIIAHPDVADTHRIERQNATISADAGYGTLRVWWAGPFKGAKGRVQFRAVFAIVGIVCVLCTASLQGQLASSLRRMLAWRSQS